MIYFDNCVETLNEMNKEISEDVVDVFEKENVKNNPYRKLADDFERFNNGEFEESDKENENYYFYQYLKSLNNTDSYSLPLSDGRKYEVKIDLFSPFTKFNEKRLVHPAWHYAVAYCIWKDAAVNHKDDNDENIRKMNQYYPASELTPRRSIPNSVFKKWFNK